MRAFFWRRREDWILDASGLAMQGLVVPLLQASLIAALWNALLPQARGSWSAPGWIAFLLNFTVIDWLYYWNHRLLHRRPIWSVHLVHHGSARLDILSTSRNSLWTPFFLVYLWVYGFFTHLLGEVFWFSMGVLANAILDLWRHSELTTPVWARATLGRILILPEDHRWHHAADLEGVNFGANLNLWDRLHGTFHRSEESPRALGMAVGVGWFDQLVRPWRADA
jgi:sterol desaturase/sphingolipid hydroxylase (fatty acid hydroxylase superfamily)